jgi:hypothetical protein
MLHFGPVGGAVGLFVGGLVYIAVDEAQKNGREFSLPLPDLQHHEKEPGEPSFLYRLTHGKDSRETVEAEPGQEDDQEQAEAVDPLFTQPQADDTGGIDRLTIDQIVANTEPNSFKIWVGRSLTKEGNPAIQIRFYKQHFRFIGASQRGKSSMVAAFLEIVTRTHDARHVQLILLDKENMTSNLFADCPHVFKMRTLAGEVVKLHATSNEQVLRYLIQTVCIMEKRYKIIEREGLAALKKLPIILIYIEEFLRLKAYFKTQVKTAKDKEDAEANYATLMYCINQLAGLGLKLRMQLLLCAQVDYADDDFREATANIGCGFSFCVKRDAAMAAGFTNAELLTRNLKENKVGQAVVECPDCNDLVLAPEYDLEARLEAWQEENDLVGGEVEQLLDDELSAEPTQQIKLALVNKQRQAEDAELERAINAYLEGANTIDKLAVALDKKPNYARGMIERVRLAIKNREAVENT